MAAEQLQKDHEAPLFLTVGLYRPHVPLFAPKRFLDLYPLKDVLLPTVLEDDMEDIPQGGRSLAHNPLPPAHAWFLKKNRWKEAVQAYLASVSFVDACVGRLIKSLDDGPMADHLGGASFRSWILSWEKRSVGPSKLCGSEPPGFR